MGTGIHVCHFSGSATALPVPLCLLLGIALALPAPAAAARRDTVARPSTSPAGKTTRANPGTGSRRRATQKTPGPKQQKPLRFCLVAPPAPFSRPLEGWVTQQEFDLEYRRQWDSVVAGSRDAVRWLAHHPKRIKLSERTVGQLWQRTRNFVRHSTGILGLIDMRDDAPAFPRAKKLFVLEPIDVYACHALAVRNLRRAIADPIGGADGLLVRQIAEAAFDAELQRLLAPQPSLPLLSLAELVSTHLHEGAICQLRLHGFPIRSDIKSIRDVDLASR